MGRFVSATVAAAVGLASCATPPADPVPVVPWAAEAEAVVSLLEGDYDTADPYEMARFFTAGGTLDLKVWGLGIGTTPAEIVDMIDDLLTPSDAASDVDAQHLFVSLDGAAVWGYSGGGGIGDWIQTYTFGDGGRTASRAFRSLGEPHRPAGQRWSASGDPVESGSICEGGSHRWVGYRRQDGSAIAYEETITLAQTHPEWVLLEMQLGCSDGTGAISIAWEPDAHDRWMVVGGIGAYSAATGGGRLERSAGRPAGAMILSGEISTG